MGGEKGLGIPCFIVLTGELIIHKKRVRDFLVLRMLLS
jgi:hypothetical protein